MVCIIATETATATATATTTTRLFEANINGVYDNKDNGNNNNNDNKALTTLSKTLSTSTNSFFVPVYV